MTATTEVPRRAVRRRPSTLTIIGLCLLLLGIGTSAWVGWELFGDPLMDPGVASQKVSDLKSGWQGKAESDGAGTVTSTVPGDAVALLRIPSFGETYEVPIVYGTDDASLSKGVGWFTASAKPGEIGNFALAGHRGCCGPFVKLPTLPIGSQVIIETQDAVFTYVLDNHPADLTVDSSQTWVIDPVPGKPGTKPTQALITLVTCAELFHSPLRNVAFGHLTDTVTKGAR
jgi:sortase A